MPLHHIKVIIKKIVNIGWVLYLQGGWTALHMAAQEGHVDVIRALTDAQTDINIQTEVHKTLQLFVYGLCRC